VAWLLLQVDQSDTHKTKYTYSLCMQDSLAAAAYHAPGGSNQQTQLLCAPTL
jgi:hypothetical protein